MGDDPEKRVECNKCGYTWISSAKTPQCSDPDDLCGRSRDVNVIEEITPPETQDGGDEQEDSHASEQEESQEDSQENEPEREESETVEDNGDTDSDEQTTEPESTGNDDDMVSPAEYQEFQTAKRTTENDDTEIHETTGTDADEMYGIDRRYVLAGAAIVAVVVLLVILKRRQGSTTSPTPEPVEEPTEPEPEPEPEPDPEPESETATQREFREQTESVSGVPLFEN